MLTVNLFDSAFAHLGPSGCSVHGKIAKRIQYVRSNLRWDGITILTDAMLCDSRTLDFLKSRVTIGWLLEPREYKPENYARAEVLLPRLDLLLTHDQRLLDSYPDKCRFTPFAGCWIPESHWGLHPKTARVVQILSGKMFMEGHRLRHEVMARFPEVDCHGWGTARGRFPHKETVLASAEFCVVIENSRAPNFWTEKLLDPMAVGCIPIFWGCPNLSQWFNMDGVIQFESIDDLPAILANLDYSRHVGAARDNLERMKPFACTDDWIAEHVLENL